MALDETIYERIPMYLPLDSDYNCVWELVVLIYIYVCITVSVLITDCVWARDNSKKEVYDNA